MGTYNAIAGTIGAGKTTLCKTLSRYMIVGYEPKSPYLERFYENPKKWAFHMQIWMMQYRYRQARELMSIPSVMAGDTKALQDRCWYEDRIFREMLYSQGNLSKVEYEMCMDMDNEYWEPDMTPKNIIYLRVSAETSIARVRERNRDAEIDVNDGYLRDLHRRYEEWADFLDNTGDYFHIVDWNQPDMDKIYEILSEDQW